MAVWFDGNLNRQLIEDNIIQSPKYGRTFTMYRYSETFINGTKSNPAWYGDILGDWREEIILPDATRLQDIKIFSTWYPTTHKFPWLMTDHCYWMSALNENIGYNQPTNTGYYLGSDIKKDATAWEEAAKVMNTGITTGIHDVDASRPQTNGEMVNGEMVNGEMVNGKWLNGEWHDLSGRRVAPGKLRKGVYVKDGRKISIK